MNADQDPSGIAAWKLERFLLGELPREEAERIAALAAVDPALAERIAALRGEDARLAAEYPADRVAYRIWSALGEEPPPVHPPAAARRPRTFPFAFPSAFGPVLRYAGPAFALLALLAIVPFRMLHRQDAGHAGIENTRIKGKGPALFLYRKAGGGSAPLAAGGDVRPGELIRIQYDAAGKLYGAIFSIDARGEIAWHLPDDGRGSSPLRAGGRVALDFAFELDSLPGDERFFFLTSDRPFLFATDLPWLFPALIAPGTPLPLPAGFALAEITLRKETGT
jgi:hypothetical protein